MVKGWRARGEKKTEHNVRYKKPEIYNASLLYESDHYWLLDKLEETDKDEMTTYSDLGHLAITLDESRLFAAILLWLVPGHAVDTEGDGGEDGDPDRSLDLGSVVRVCLDNLGQHDLEGLRVEDCRCCGRL